MLKRLNDVMAHLEQRFDQPVDVAELARISFRLTLDGSGSMDYQIVDKDVSA